MRKLLFALCLAVLVLPAAVGCMPVETKSIKFRVSTEPPGALALVENFDCGVTPTIVEVYYKSYAYVSRSRHADEYRTRSLTLRKDGYKPAVFRFSIADEKYKEIPEVVYLTAMAEKVSVTGSAGMLQQLTTGGAGEHALDVSPDKEWLLIETFEFGPKASNNRVLQKLKLDTGSKVVLSPKTSGNCEGNWLADMSGIVFTTDRLGKWTIVQSLGVSGAVGVRFITKPDLGNARMPAVSPDGKHVAFCVSGETGESQIAIIGIDGTNLRMYGTGSQPSWSPDGTKIAFCRKVGKYTHIYTMDSDTGTELVEVSSMEANDYHPTWSPDGEHIAFVSDRIGARRHLFVMKPNGMQVTQLTDGLFEVGTICWGADGLICFSANAGGSWDVWRVKPKLK